jgi:tryptophan 7-halogenase
MSWQSTGGGQLRTAQLRTVIVGEEFPAVLVAAALARHQDLASRPVQVLVLPATAGDPAWPADATLPWYNLPRLRALLDEDAVIATAGAFSWGIALSGWSGDGSQSFHPFGSFGAPFGPIGFPHVVQRLRSNGAQLRFANFSLSALAAQAGRFLRPGRDPRSVLTTAEYGLHVDLRRLATRLRQDAQVAGVAFDRCDQITVVQDESGTIRALDTNQGRRIEGDFFVDCSPKGLLRPAARDGSDWIDWSGWFRADRALSCCVDAPEAPEPFSEVRTMAGGWLRRVPVPGRAAITGRFSTQHMDDTALHVALRSLAGAGVSDLCITHTRFGRRAQAWQANVLSLGAAAASIDPLLVSDLQLLCIGVERLLGLLPADPDEMHAERAEFNRRFGGYADRARDLAIAHYWLNGRRGEPFWDAARAMSVPESLAGKRELYEGRGQVVLLDDEPVEHWGWISLFDEFGVRPRCYSPLADGVPPEQLAAHAAKARALMLDAVARMPAHGAYLATLAAGQRERAS